MAFDLSDLLKGVSDSDTGREQIEYIGLALIDGDAGNFYELSDIEKLANNIATVGLQQPLRLRPHPETEGRYMIVSGHRRKAALNLLVQEDPERWKEVACIVQRDSVSPAMQQLRLIFANSDTRKMSSADLNEQAAQVEKLLYQLKEEGYEFPGRMRDHVAGVVQISKTKLARLKMIRDNLADCWQPLYKKGKLVENTAYEVAKIPPEAQKILFDVRMQNDPRLGSFWAEDASAFAKTCKQIEKLKCHRRGRSCDCQNTDNKKKRAAALHYYSTCYCTKCCADCVDLITCKYACSVMADKVKRMKNDRKEANRQAELAQEKKDRPTIELLQRLWYRFGYAREQAKVSIKSALLAVGKVHNANVEKSVKDLEDCTAKFNVNTTEAPYGFSYDLRYIRTLCTLADMFGCSVDYLLCRTDVREVAQAAPEQKENVSNSDTELPKAPAEGWIPLQWLPGLEIPYKQLRAQVRFDMKDGYPPVEVTAHWRGQNWQFKDGTVIEGQCLSWFPLPPEVPNADSHEAENPLNHSCKTGMSPSGHCGAAAACPEPTDCCLNCDKDCNLRCGWTEVSEC